jgi:hypothetical protein
MAKLVVMAGADGKGWRRFPARGYDINAHKQRLVMAGLVPRLSGTDCA